MKAQNGELHAMFLAAVPRSVKMEFELMRSFVQKSELFFEEKTPPVSKYESADNSVTLVNYTDRIQHINLTQILRCNTFVSAVTMLESHFTEMVESIIPEKVKLRVRDIKSENLNKPYEFATKVLGINISAIAKQMQQFEDYYKVRNLIVHRNGLIKYDNEAKPILKYQPLTSIKDNFLVIESKEFTLKFCDESEKFLINVVDAFVSEFAKD
jgi:hypothetical protein